jgi:hypothetical protein
MHSPMWITTWPLSGATIWAAMVIGTASSSASAPSAPRIERIFHSVPVGSAPTRASDRTGVVAMVTVLTFTS